MTEKNPIAYFTVNHGETTDTSTLWNLLQDAGYDVREIDLLTEDIDYIDAQLIIINGPQYDFTGIEADVNEIKKIDDFLDNVGSLMVFMDASARSKQSFSNLDELLYEWGISYGDSVVYDPSNCINVDGTALISNYTEEGNGATLTKSMRTISNVPRTTILCRFMSHITTEKAPA